MAEHLWRVSRGRSVRRRKPQSASRSPGEYFAGAFIGGRGFSQGIFRGAERIEVVIAPGQRAQRGGATIAAVLGYAGESFPWRERGEWRTVYGWQQLKRQRFSFGNRLSAACDVPDLELFPERYAGVQSVTFRAALEVSLQHYGLWMIGACRRMGLPMHIPQWGATLDRIGLWLDWLEARRAGCQSASRDEAMRPDPEPHVGARCRIQSRPEIPCMAAVILATQLARGDPFRAGAKVCMGMLGLSDFEAEFARWHISSRVMDEP